VSKATSSIAAPRMIEARTPWTRLRSAVAFAVDALGTRRQRALLALLGIAIGVAAVVALLALGRGLERQAQDDFKAIGTQVIDVSLNDGSAMLFKARPLSEKPARQRPNSGELVSMLRALPEVELVSPAVAVSCSGSAAEHRQVSAVQPEFAAILGLQLATGRFIHPLDGHELWVVLGRRTAEQLASTGQPVVPGGLLRLCGRMMRLAGVLAAEKGATAVVPVSLDEGALISVRAAQRIDPQAATTRVVLRVRPDVLPEEFSSRLASHLHTFTGQSPQINTARQVLELMRTQTESITRFLVALSSLSLLVGSLGILNVMLMSVLERRSEIGLRMAIGADDIDIGLQFLAESALLGLAGGGIGLVLGLAAAWATSIAVGLPFVVTASDALLAIVVSLLVGAAAGLHPALKASRLYPVEALHTVR
jgi:putative ABC transport system permease protein